MKQLIKLAFAALLVYAAWNFGNVWLNYIRFRDTVSEIAQYGDALSDDQIRDKVLESAQQHSIALAEEAVTVRRDDRHHTYVDGSYTQPVNVLPWYAYPLQLGFHTDTFTLSGAQGLVK